MSQTNIHNNTLTIVIEEVALFVKIILSVFLCICAFMPILVAYFLFYSGLTMGILISFAFFWTIGFFGLRSLLWNFYGKEIILFDDDSISYCADFRLFTSKEYSIKNKEISFVAIEELEGKSRFKIKNESEEIETSIKVPTSELNLLIEKLKATPNK